MVELQLLARQLSLEDINGVLDRSDRKKSHFQKGIEKVEENGS